MTPASADDDVESTDEADEVEAAQLDADDRALRAERDDLLDVTRRLQADFENYRKRVLREQTALVERATEGLLEQLLPVLDSFELRGPRTSRAPTSTSRRCARASSSCSPSCSARWRRPGSSASSARARRSTPTSTKR